MDEPLSDVQMPPVWPQLHRGTGRTWEILNAKYTSSLIRTSADLLFIMTLTQEVGWTAKPLKRDNWNEECPCALSQGPRSLKHTAEQDPPTLKLALLSLPGR